MDRLLTRDAFRESVFKRDGHKCVFCKETATEAHHILDRKLYPDGGYYLSNGASVCNPCHMKCETTEFSVELVRETCGIIDPVLPPGFNSSTIYDKWGNEHAPDGRRFQGPLFQDTAVQKLLKMDLWRYEQKEN